MSRRRTEQPAGAQAGLRESRCHEGWVMALGTQLLAPLQDVLLVVGRQGLQEGPALRGEQRAQAGDVHRGILARPRAGTVARSAGTQVDRVLITGIDSLLALSRRVCQL